MKICRAFVVLLLFGTIAAGARADVVVIANRSRERVEVVVRPQLGQAELLPIAANDLVAIPTQGGVVVEVLSGAQRRRARYELDANCSYYLGDTADGTVQLTEIGLGGDQRTRGGRSLAGAGPTGSDNVIPIKILVDDDEPATKRVWEQRLRRRVDRVSEILERHCALRMQIVASATWKTDDAVRDFGESLAEFERQVHPAPARLAIGFTSQYQIPQGRTHVGGTRGPLHSHILIREWSQHIPEAQRVELLLHELGHYLGAAHSPEPDSVMRPVLLRGQASVPRSFLRFDPVNTLIMYLVGEEIRARRVWAFRDMTVGTRQRLGQIYGELARAFPSDPIAEKYTRQLEVPPARSANPLLADTRHVVSAIVRSAPAARSISRPSAAAAPESGDALTRHYVRSAARAADGLSPRSGPTAMILAIGIALDDSDRLRTHAKTGEFVCTVEPAERRSARITAIGQPTMRGRREAARQFVVSAYLAAVVGREAAEAAWSADVQDDSSGRRDAGYATLVASQAGILFARGVLSGQISLEHLAGAFSVEDYLPELSHRPEQSGAGRPVGQTATADARAQLLREVRQEVAKLPAYGREAAEPLPAAKTTPRSRHQPQSAGRP